MSLQSMQVVSKMDTNQLKVLAQEIVRVSKEPNPYRAKKNTLLQNLLSGSWPVNYMYLDRFTFLQEEIRREIFYRFLTDKL